MSHVLAVSRGLAWRSLILVRRMPSVFLPSLIMPLFILIATAGAFRGISLLPAFEGASYLAFTIPLATVMGAGFAGINAGHDPGPRHRGRLRRPPGREPGAAHHPGARAADGRRGAQPLHHHGRPGRRA